MTTVVVGSCPARNAMVLTVLLAVFQSAAFANAVGYTPGEASVDPTGASNYRIPIAVPPGRGGLQPDLALLYHSRAGNGHLGVGWSVEGLSAITRCPAAWEPDGYTDGVRLEASDRFCLDGQKLLAVSGTYGASGTEYRTEIESFRGVVSYGTAGTGPARFQVHTNAGLIIEYGGTTDSQVLAEGSSTALLWAVSRIADRNGNAIEFIYQQNASTGEYQVSEIRYQGQAAITVKFNYSSRPDVSTGWIAGSRTGLSVRLENIETRYSGSLVRRYDFSYTTGAKSGRSLLTSVTECNPTECFPPTALSWLQGYRQFMSTMRQLGSGAMESMRILDMNGDGWPDVVYWRAGHWRLRLGPHLDTEIAGPACDQNTDACQAARGYGLTYRSTFGRDILYIPSGTSAYQRLVYSDTGGLQIFAGGPPKDGHEHALVLDLNGDGFQDVITVPAAPGGGPRFRAFLGHATGTVASGHAYEYDGTGAMYGATVFPLDGRPGFIYGGCGGFVSPQEGGPEPNGCIGQLRHMTFNGVTFTSTPVTNADWYASELNHVSPTFKRVADVNGDGLPDLLYLQDADSFTHDTHWRLLLNNGKSFEPAVMTSIPRGSSFGQIHAIDWRGDGTGVLAVPNTAQTRWEYWGWNGTGFTLLDTTSDLSSTQALGQVQYLDLNRDDVVDRLIFTGSSWYIRFGVPVFHDLLEGATVGEGNLDLRSSFSYAPLGNPKFYTPGDPYWQGGYERAVGTMAVVAHVASDTGLSNTGSPDTQVFTSYNYARGRVHRHGRGFAGFEEVTAINENSLTRTVNRHLFEFPYTGMVSSTEQRMITGYALDDKTFDNFSATSPRYLMLGACNEPGIDFGPGVCDLEPPAPSEPPMTAYIDQPTFTVGNIVSASSHTYSSGPVASAPASIQYPRVDETTESSRDIATGNELRKTVTSFVYDDSFGNPTTITATTTNGSGGDLHRVTTTNGYSNDVGSWCLGRVTSASAVHEAPGAPSLTRSSSFAYQNCQLVSESIDDAPSLTTTYQHDGFGNRVRTSVAGSGQTRTTVSNYGLSGTFPVAVTNALGHSETRSWDGRFGVMTGQTGPNGLTTSWTYDDFGRRLSETPPGGAPQQTTWSRAWCSPCAHPAARIRVATRTPAVLAAADDATITELDAHGREVTAGSRTFSGGWVYEYTYYDSLGRVARKSLPTSEASATSGSIPWVEYKYDQLGRVVEETRPRLNDVTAYDYEGLLTRTRHLPGTTEQRISERVVNVMDRLVAYSDVTPQGTLTTTYGYDAVGNTVSVTDADVQTTAMQYDARGNKIQMAAPEMGTWSYLHNAFGELTQQTDAEGNVVTQQYDALGRMVGRVDADGTTIWTYDASFGAGVGKPASVETVGVDGYWEGYAYDIHGQLTDTFTEVDGEIHWTSTDYDEFGRVALVQYPDVVVEAATGGGPPAPPTGLAASPAVSADGAFTVEWNNVSGPVIRYHLQEERIGGTSGWRNAYYGTALTVLLPGREDGATYQYRIRACGTECGTWSTESDTVSVVRAPDAPGVPRPSVNATSTGSFTVDWDASPGPNLTGYRLERRQDGGAWQPVTLADPTATSHSASITPTPDLRTYTYRVQAHNQNGAGSDWVEGYPVLVQGPPAQPGSITVPATTTAAFAVEWTAAAGTVDRYELYRATSAGFGDEQLVHSGGGYAHSDSPADGSYYYRVRACNDLAGCGQPRASGEGVKLTPPPPPHSFVPLQQTFYNQQVYVSWQAMSTPDRYEVFRTSYGVMPNPGVDTPVCSGTALSCQDPAPDGWWDYYVRACVSFACSEAYKAPHPVEVLHSPGIPASISVPPQVTNGTVSLSWGGSSGSVASYELYESTSSSFSSQTLVYNGAGQSKQLSRGAGTYYYRVRACNAAGCSGYRTGSNAATVIVAPGQPSSISVPGGYVTNGTISVSWGSASNSPTWYELYENSSLVYSGMGYGTTLYGRGNGTYNYQVRACNAAGCGPYRVSSGVTVLYLPSTPTGFYAQPTYSTEGWYDLFWSAASGASYYEVSGHGTVSGTWASITQFANGNYSHYVRACNAAGCSGWAGPVSVTVQMCSWNCQEQ